MPRIEELASRFEQEAPRLVSEGDRNSLRQLYISTTARMQASNHEEAWAIGASMLASLRHELTAPLQGLKRGMFDDFLSYGEFDLRR